MFESWQGREIFHFSKTFVLAVGPRLYWVPLVPSTVINLLGFEADHSPHGSSKVKKKWSYTSTPFICLHGMCRGNCTLLTIGISGTPSCFSIAIPSFAVSLHLIGRLLANPCRTDHFLICLSSWLLLWKIVILTGLWGIHSLLVQSVLLSSVPLSAALCAVSLSHGEFNTEAVISSQN